MQVVREQTRALTVMPNNLDQVAAAASKNIEITNMRIALQKPSCTKRARLGKPRRMSV